MSSFPVIFEYFDFLTVYSILYKVLLLLQLGIH